MSAKRRPLAWEVNPDTGCFEVTSHKPSSNGYVYITVDGKLVLAHRYMYETANGPLPDGYEVCHSCDRRNCINLAHLWKGTHLDNMLDMNAKGHGRAGKGDKSDILLVRVTPEMYEDIRAVAKNNHHTVSEEVRIALAQGLGL